MKTLKACFVMIIFLTNPYAASAKDAQCETFGFKADAGYVAKMNAEAKSMKEIISIALKEKFGDIKTCVHSSVENKFLISDGKRTIVNDLRSGVTSFIPQGSTKPSKCFNSNLFKVYMPVNGSC